MRDNHDRLPEILDAYEKDGHYFGVIQGKPIAFEIGVELAGYRALRRILQSRPFGATLICMYRYFFVPNIRRLEPEVVEFAVRIEQGRNGRQFLFAGPRSLAANLKWFFELSDLNAAAHLKQVAVTSSRE